MSNAAKQMRRAEKYDCAHVAKWSSLVLIRQKAFKQSGGQRVEQQRMGGPQTCPSSFAVEETAKWDSSRVGTMETLDYYYVKKCKYICILFSLHGYQLYLLVSFIIQSAFKEGSRFLVLPSQDFYIFFMYFLYDFTSLGVNFLFKGVPFKKKKVKQSYLLQILVFCS